MSKITRIYDEIHELESKVAELKEKARELSKPKVCPKCNEKDSLEYVMDQVLSCEVSITHDKERDKIYVECGEVNEYGDTNFHHISCCQCDTYWESKYSFAEEVEKSMKKSSE